MTAKSSTSRRKSRNIFKGFPLEDFLHPNALDVDNIFSHPSLVEALKSHVEEFDRSGYSDESAVNEIDVRTPCITDVVNVTDKNMHRSGRANISRENPSNAVKDKLFVDPDNIRPPFGDMLKDFLKGLYLGKFESSVVQPVATRSPLLYIFEIGFNTDKTTGFIVKSPLDTLITFGPRDPRYPYNDSDKALVRIPSAPKFEVASSVASAAMGHDVISKLTGSAFKLTFGGSSKAVSDPRKISNVCDLNFRITVNDKNQLQQLSMFGDTVKVHLSTGLVLPVERTKAGKWAKTGRRLRFSVGERIITFKRNHLPTWGGVIDLGGIPVSISSSNVIGRLSKINLGGTPEKPLIVFDDVEILK